MNAARSRDPLAELHAFTATPDLAPAAAKSQVASWRGDTDWITHIAVKHTAGPEFVEGPLERLRLLPGLSEPVKRLRKDILRRAREVEQAAKALPDPSDPSYERTLLSTCLPCLTRLAGAEDLWLPPGWRVGAEGVFLVKRRFDGDQVVQIAAYPLVIAARSKDLDTGRENVELAWFRDGTWTRRWCPRATIKTMLELVRLADLGAPVSQITAADLVRFLDAFEKVNAETLRTIEVSATCGWKGVNGASGFLLGHEHIRPSGVPLIEFRAEEGGGEIAGAVRCRGTLEGWRAVEAIARRYPKVMVALYASVAPVLLTPLGVKGFNVDFAAVTSTGKTTALKVGASVWGSPDESAADGLVRTWDATATAIQRLAATLCHLPLFLDETKRAANPTIVAQTLYIIPQGQGKARGNRNGLDRIEHWQTVLLSTGERPATSFRNDGGANARTLQFWGPPLDGTAVEEATDARRLQALVSEHYGHVGRAIVQRLVGVPGAIDEVRGWYRRASARWEEVTSASHVAGRAATTLAMLEVVQQMLHVWLDFAPPADDPLTVARDAVIAGARDADMAAMVLPDILAWAVQHRSRFFGQQAEAPNTGWLGAWVPGDAWTEIAFVPHELRHHLIHLGHEAEAILRAWHERKWTIADPRRTTTRRRIDGFQAHCVVLRRSALEGDHGG